MPALDFDVLRTTTQMGIGLAALGRPGYITLNHADDLNRNYEVEAMQQHAHAVLDAAWQAGIRCYDAARSYGRGEEFLGNWLRTRAIDPAEVFVSSKWGYTYTANWQVKAEQHEVKKHSLPVLERQRKESTHFLSPYLRLYQVHSATFQSGILENKTVLMRLAEMRRAGMYIGLSVSGADQGDVLRRALTISVDGQTLFQSVQATWNLLETSAEPALQEAHDRGLLVIVKEVLANGRLTLRNTEPDFQPRLERLKQQAARLNTTLDALAIAAAAACPWSHIILSGAATPDQVRSNARGLQVRIDEEAQAALASLAEPPDRYWETRSNLPWN